MKKHSTKKSYKSC